jgi:MSHA biogenesis protein MshQ
VRAGNLTGAFNAANPATGSADGGFVYDEVGSFRLQTLGVVDDGFTLVDSAQGDCIDGFGNSPDASGKVGCRFGNDLAGDWVGRFMPDHFRLTVDAHGQLADTCPAGAFSYAGQDVGYQPGGEPVATVTAYNGLGTPTVTRNYTGDHNHLTVPGILMAALTGDGSKMRLDGSGPVSLTWNQGVASLVDNGDGTLQLTLSGDSFNYSRADIDRVDPFVSDLDLEIQSITDGDGVSATGLPDGFAPLGVQIRYGRLVLENSFGSELLHLPVPLRVEYFAGTANGFVPNTDDSCSQVLGISLTDLDASDNLTVSTGVDRETAVYASAAIAGGYAEENPGNPALLFSQPTAGADYNLNLQAPGEANTGTAGVLVDAPDWLEYDWQGAGMTDPFSRASFGIFSRGGSAIVYLREMR